MGILGMYRMLSSQSNLPASYMGFVSVILSATNLPSTVSDLNIYAC